VAEWIGRQVAAHPDNHFVVTSRSYDLLGPLAVQADVLVARPFTAKQVQLFLDRWYLAAERHATGASGRTAGGPSSSAPGSPPTGSTPCSRPIRRCTTWRSTRCC
jgi:hypothetical protein